MSRMSHREFLGWLAWLDSEVERPDKTEWYLMQLTRFVWLAKHPNSKLNINDFRLSLIESENNSITTKAAEEKHLANQKAVVASVFGKAKINTGGLSGRLKYMAEANSKATKQPEPQLPTNPQGEIDYGPNRRAGGPSPWR